MGLKLHTILFYATQNVVNVVWEESLGIEHGLDQSRYSSKGHILVMGMSVPLQNGKIEGFNIELLVGSELKTHF